MPDGRGGLRCQFPQVRPAQSALASLGAPLPRHRTAGGPRRAAAAVAFNWNFKYNVYAILTQ